MPFFTDRSLRLALVGICASLAFAGPASAGDGNIVYIEQQSYVSGVGNTLFVDQSDATESTVAGDTAGLTPATQIGGDNRADITLTGFGGTVLLSQTNDMPGLGQPNTATITGGAYARAFLSQDGFGNSGTLDVGSGGNTAALFQDGERNTGTVTVFGTGNTGTLRQQGNDNTSALEVSGSGTNVQWNQIGNGLSSASAVVPAQVYTNAGTITITQISQ